MAIVGDGEVGADGERRDGVGVGDGLGPGAPQRVAASRSSVTVSRAAVADDAPAVAAGPEGPA